MPDRGGQKVWIYFRLRVPAVAPIISENRKGGGAESLANNSPCPRPNQLCRAPRVLGKKEGLDPPGRVRTGDGRAA